MIKKQIHSQDAYYKISPKKSGETSLNLSKEVLNYIRPDLTRGNSTTIVFTLYRADYLKALGAIFSCSSLYTSTSISATRVQTDPNSFSNDFQSICSFFGGNETCNYTVNLLHRNDGRIYLNSLEDHASGFNIRHFLIEEKSTLIFDKDENGIILRLSTDPTNDIKDIAEATVITQERQLTTFVLKVIRYFNGIDSLNALIPYSSATSPVKISKENVFALTGMFLESTIDQIKQRNADHVRWFEDQFMLGERVVYLSTQWNSQGNYQLTLDDFTKMIKTCYGNKYDILIAQNGDYQLVIFDIDENDENPLQQIFFGTPGSGKSHKVKTIVDGKYPDPTEREKCVFRTTFHPDSDYASFVGCYKPQMDGDTIKYEFTPQAFTNAYVKSWKQDDDVYLIIEEINRGNCAQIFGDLFQLLDREDGESEYPINADADLKQYLLKEEVLGEQNEGIIDGKLKLRKNLHILATMNTSDQSLFPMDSAFKRRWAWEYVPIEYDNAISGSFTIELKGKKYNWSEFLKAVNKKIFDTTQSEDKQMGNFFIDGNVNERQFIDKVMFYLWNDICKEEYGTSNNFLRVFTDGKRTDTEQFTFNNLFEEEKNKDLLIRFMDYLDVKPVKDTTTEQENTASGLTGEQDDKTGSSENE